MDADGDMGMGPAIVLVLGSARHRRMGLVTGLVPMMFEEDW